jgi:His-Xaa-Ser system radical SAM maturase HxsC
VYVTKDLSKNYWLYNGVLSSIRDVTSYGRGRIPCVFDIKPDSLDALKEGDIVLLEPDGKVNVLWDINSHHNSILATGECNCSCIMCPQPRKKDPKDLLEFNLKLIDLIDPKRTENIGITGGEPTLLGTDLIKLISACKERLPKASLSLLTNGRRLSDLDLAKELVEIGHPNLVICIALYADNDKEHDRIMGVEGSFYETLGGLKNLALLRQKVEIRNVIHALNYRRLRQFSEFIYHNFPFVIHVALMGMETTGLAFKNIKTLWIDPAEYMPELRSAVRYLNRRDMHVSIYNLQLCILPREIWRFARKSISDWKNTFLQECRDCYVRAECSGFFGTSEGWQSKHIHRITC